jgi:glycosyltransferase involved in cell wall biosynthesis
MKTLIIIPAYNEESSIAAVIKEIQSLRRGYDIIVIDDGSTDRTFEEARGAGARVLRLPINLGIGAAVQTGFRYALRKKYDAVIQVDGDGQHDPRFIDALLSPISADEADVVIGSRFLKRSGYRSTWPRRFGSRIFSLINSAIIRQEITDNTSGFRAYSRPSFEYLADRYPSDYPEPETIVLLARKKYRMLEKPVAMRQRLGGRSSISALMSIYYMAKVLLSIGIDLLKTKEERQQ